ncbi:MAG: sulfur carrier protein ThiS [Sulfurospirillaceae bacterium]|jgi:sulfur carrier protein|nr:sulfur carrier protein ThiS [Sulfurospirillaceae bacterium]MDD2826064.1 sulfur carrier protein ThiS [Sulfurospirillaceae bacterium]
MHLVVNGEPKNCQAQTIKELLEEIGIEEKVMAAAVNMNVVKKDNWATFLLNENDRVEFLQFVGGG